MLRGRNKIVLRSEPYLPGLQAGRYGRGRPAEPASLAAADFF